MPKHSDTLQVQVAFKIKAPPGATFAPEVFKQLIDRMIRHEPLPKNVEVRGIFWRNPDRKGKLSYWRYHAGADLKAAPRNAPIESSPRGNLRDAIDTLSGALYSGIITF